MGEKERIIGENIRFLRDSLGYTQAGLAQYLDVDQSLISKIEKGERSVSVSTLKRISLLFGVSMEQLNSENMAEKKLSYAFRGSRLTLRDMETIAAINKIALNLNFMNGLLEDEKDGSR